MSKRKVINDPVHGFITIPYDIIFQIIEHPYFQRLRRIRQLGLTDYVYPGALHTRFHHALGAFHLMYKAIFIIRQKGQEITQEEEIGALIAILMHDIGHGPFSHTLEKSIVKNVSHEAISGIYMERLNDVFSGQLDIAIEIFKGTYHKHFLHQLVNGQLDVDRLDYLTRDSFFTGVSEGIINYNRIIDMMNIHDGELVVESKAFYSIERFLTSRRIMYWQVYLHKTVVCVEDMLIRIFERVRVLYQNQIELLIPDSIAFFLKHTITEEDFRKNKEVLASFSNLDDYDFFSAIKSWTKHSDWVLSYLCNALIHRRLLKIEIFQDEPPQAYISELKQLVQSKYPQLKASEIQFLVFSNKLTNYTYDPSMKSIRILQKNGQVKDFSEVSDRWNISSLDQPISRYYVCYPKEIQHIKQQ